MVVMTCILFHLLYCMSCLCSSCACQSFDHHRVISINRKFCAFCVHVIDRVSYMYV